MRLSVIPLLFALSAAAQEIVKRAPHNGIKDRMGGDDPQALAKRDGSKYVFMHHIVGNTYLYGAAEWENDVREIAARGVDAIALNIGSASWQKTQVELAYDAAAKIAPQLKMFISFDYTEMPCDVADTVARVKAVSGHPQQFRVNGKPMISSYSGGDFGNAGWAAIKSQTDGYLMPFIWGLEVNFGSWPALDSWYCWGCAWPQWNKPKDLDDDRYYIGQLQNRFATTLSGWFYAGFSWKNEVLRSDEWLINRRWEQVMEIRNQLTFVEMLTWNDWGESDYFYEVTPGTSQPKDTYWADKFPHTAWYDMSAYYISAFKTGVYPTIAKDVIYYWSTPHPVGSTASAPTVGKPNKIDWLQGQDYLYAAVFASAESDVTLTMGSSTSTSRVQKGVTKLRIRPAPGKISVKMVGVASKVTTISKTDPDFEYTNNPVKYNYNAYVSSATHASGDVAPPVVDPTTTTTTPIPDPTPAPTPVTPVTPPATTTNAYLGCYVDPNSPRVLNGPNSWSDSQTIDKCLATCKSNGFAYGGVEWKGECWCGSEIASGSIKTAEAECNTPCNGKSSEMCGGGNRISLFSIAGTLTTPVTPSTPPASTANTYVACYVDPGDKRVLNGGSTWSDSQTVDKCLTSCKSRGFAVGGLEYKGECWCGSVIFAGAMKANEHDCDTPCNGKTSETCGGGNRISIWTIGTSATTPPLTPTPTVTRVTPPATISPAYIGCYVDPGDARILTVNTWSDSQTVDKCLTSCKASGFMYGGLQWKGECWCGSSVRSAAVKIVEAECNTPCNGKSSDTCGGGNRMSMYSLSAATASTWSGLPSGWSAAGCYIDSSTRILSSFFVEQSGMTTKICIGICAGKSLSIAATEYGSQCMCGSTIVKSAGSSGVRTAANECNMKCGGNAAQICGAGYRANVYTGPGAPTLSRREPVRRLVADKSA